VSEREGPKLLLNQGPSEPCYASNATAEWTSRALYIQLSVQHTETRIPKGKFAASIGCPKAKGLSASRSLASPDPLTRGSAPGLSRGLCPRPPDPVMGSFCRARHDDSVPIIPDYHYTTVFLITKYVSLPLTLTVTFTLDAPYLHVHVYK